jgi:hypothetical protein
LAVRAVIKGKGKRKTTRRKVANPRRRMIVYKTKRRRKRNAWKTGKTHSFRKGDRVKYKAASLKSMFLPATDPTWFAKGKVTKTTSFGPGRKVVHIRWDDGTTARVLDAHLLPEGSPDYTGMNPRRRRKRKTTKRRRTARRRNIRRRTTRRKARRKNTRKRRTNRGRKMRKTRRRRPSKKAKRRKRKTTARRRSKRRRRR